jgi:hypothetical protein
MTEQQTAEIIALLKKNNEFLASGIILLENLLRLFEKYDAEMLFEDESIRNLLSSKGAGRP